MIMESLSKLKNTDETYKRIIFIHSMIKEDWDDYKKLVEEAKKITGREYIEGIHLLGEWDFRKLCAAENLTDILNILYSNGDCYSNKRCNKCN